MRKAGVRRRRTMALAAGLVGAALGAGPGGAAGEPTPPAAASREAENASPAETTQAADATETSLDGRAIAERVDARPRGADQELRATWRLIDENGGERVRETRTFWRDHRGEEGDLHSKRLIVFDAPAPIRGTAFLVWSQRDPDDEDPRWIHLPALKGKVRRIAGGDRGRSFVGTDFAYEDLAERAVEEDTHRLLRREELRGRPHYVIESRPRGDSSYERRLQWIDAERWTVSKIEFYDRPDRLAKVLEIRWQQVDGVWAWEHLEMRDPRREHRTVVEVEEVRHDLGLDDSLFTESTLRFGTP